MSFKQQLKPTTKGNPCPVCQDTTGKCRHATQDEAWLCATHSSIKTNDIFGEFTCTGHSKDGFWGVFKINDSDWSEDKRREWRNDQALRREKAKREDEKLEREHKEKALSAVERHKFYSEIRDELITSDLRADLRKSRGLSDSENAAVEVFHVRKYHQLSKKYDSRLPGLNKFDKSQLGNVGEGLLGFVRNVDGLITGFQIRLDKPIGDGRYRWGSSNETPAHTKEFAELPLALYIPSELKSLEIQLVEGTIIKPAIAAERTGKITIAAAGGNFTSSERTFNSFIKKVQETLCQIVQENGLISIQTNNEKPKHQSESTKNTAPSNQPKLKPQSKTAGKQQSGSINPQLSSCLTSNSTTWLYRNLTNSLLKNQNLTLSTSNTVLSQNFSHAALSSSDLNNISIMPDAGDTRNETVTRRWRKLTNLLIDWDINVKFTWWGQVNKNFGDIDELSPEQYSTIRYLSVAEFKAFCIKWGGLEKPEEINNTVPFSYEERVAAAQKRLTTLQRPAEIICNPTQKYLPDLVGQVPLKGLLALKSPKGSGKSTQIKKIKDHCCGYWEEKEIIPETPELPPEQLKLFGNSIRKQGVKPDIKPQTKRVFHEGLGMKFLSINARIALGRAQAVEWQFTWVDDADLDGKEEFGEKLSTTSIIENIDEIGLCWDSLGKVFGRDWSNTMVVIDETELGLNHLVTSSTCRDRRSFILLTIEKKLKECLDNDGLVVLADADLTDCSLDYLTTITPGHTPFLVSHDFKGDPWEVDFYTGKRDEILTQIDDWLSDENCEPIAVTLDNQLEAESLSNYLTKKYPYLNNEVGGLIRIDSKVTQTDFGKNFVKFTNQKIKDYKPKILIYTPSLGVGCSIHIHHFARVFGLFYGNLEPSQCRQMLARVREAVPRTVWAKQRGMTPENEPTSYLPEAIKERLFSFSDSSHKLIDLAQDMARAEVGSDATDKELLPKLIEILQNMMAPDGTWNNPHVNLYCAQIARRNFSMAQLAVQMREELLEEGHRVNDCETEGSTNAGDSVKDGKQEIKLREAHKTATAPDVTIEEAQQIRRKPSRSDEEEHSAAKAFLKRELPGIELTTDFVHRAVYQDKRKSLNQVKLHWWVLNANAVAFEDKREWQQKLKQFSDGVPFLPDVRTYSPKVKAIHECGVFDWIKPDDFETKYCNNSDGAKEFLDRTLKIKKLVKTALGITVTKNSEPIALAKRILDRLGLGMVSAGRAGKDGERIRYYTFDPRPMQDDFRSSVFSAQKNRWEKICSEMATPHEQHTSQSVHYSHNSLVIKPSSGRTSNEISQAEKSCSTSKFVVHNQASKEEEHQELINQIAADLDYCADAGMIADLRIVYQPADLKIAARQLTPEKREQIKSWVLAS